MTRPPLICSLGGRPVARVLDAGGPCAIEYLPDIVAELSGRRLLSVRLAVGPEPVPSQHGAQVYLDGVLPEGWVRDQLADRARLAPDDTFGLLHRYGGDCAGAVSFRSPDDPEVAADVRWLEPATLANTLADLRTLPLGDGTDTTVRLSLGGVQEKLIAVVEGERVGIPVGGTPSTHILKPSPLLGDGSERHPGIAHVEHLCLDLARQMAEAQPDRTTGIGFSVPSTRVWEVAGREVLVVERYDRVRTGDGPRRLHQEDGCQVMGLAPTQKYQRSPDQPPTLRSFAKALEAWGVDPILDQRALLQQITFTACVGNADLHAKNLSVLHDDGVRLAPMYDVVATAGYDVDGELGLRIGGEYHIEDVSRSALVDEAESWGLSARAAHAAIDVVIDGVLGTDVAPPSTSSDAAAQRVAQTIRSMRARAERIAANAS